LIGRTMVVACIAVAAAGGLVWWQYFSVYHLAVVRDGVLYRDGVRSVRELATALRRVRPRTIVSLVDDREITREPFVSEMSICREKQIEVVRIPIPLGGWPGGEQIRQFLAIANDPARQPVLVHCAQGVRRTGMIVAAYQESVMKMDRRQAIAAMRTFGHSQRTIGDVRRFIELYDPQAERMTQDLPLSSE
jgi:predicted protein tyrosine phosphatase